MGAVFVDRIPLSKRIGGWLNACKSAGVITDALVNANATVTALNTAILAAVVSPSDKPRAITLTKALERAVDLSLIPETHGVTTVAGLVALTDASTTFRQSFLGS